MGQLDVTQQVAERILSKSRTQRNKEHNNAYSRAYSDFRYHIIRPETKKDSATVSTQVDVVEQALALVESMTKAQQEKFFKRVTRK
jgi:virulence-associated protein VapD